MNRYSYPGVDRQGWVYFQRSPDSSYPNSDGVGWNFRTYTGNGGSTGINITSQVPYRLGEWQHVVTVWDGPAQTATMFIDGVQAASQTLAGGYVANTGDHPASEAVNGPAGLSLGAYNNTEAGSNPFRGAIDEFAFYDRKLTPEQILAHYQNGTNATRATPYEQLILSDEPIVYLRLDDPVPGPGVAVNMGLLQNAGMATNTAEVRHTTPGALAGETGGAFAYHWRNGSATTLFPWLEEHNPTEWEPFTIEVWLRPTSDRINPGASPINNRYVASGNRTGWIFFQRAPNDTPACPVTKGWDGTSECLPAPEEGEAA